MLKSLLFDYIRYREIDPTSKWVEKYGIVIYEKNKLLKWVEAGNANEIDKLIDSYLRLAQSPGTPDAESKPALRGLFDLLVAPALSTTSKIGRIVVCPDSLLSQVSFAVLLTPDEGFLGEKTEIVYLNSTRDLKGEVKEMPSGGRAAITAGPDFEWQMDAIYSPTSSFELAARLPFEPSRLIPLKPLPGALEEGQTIGKLATSLGFSPLVMTDKDASESSIRLGLTPAPTLIHFATHGLVLPVRSGSAANKFKSAELTEIMPAVIAPSATNTRGMPFGILDSGGSRSFIDSPLERSMLALGGANVTFKGWTNGVSCAPSTDGLFLTSEISLMDFKSTYLTVLSACNTAGGYSVSGEGVMGLRRGFFMAGTANLVMTFWVVNDKSTPVFFSDFYTELGESRHPATALYAVQSQCLREARLKPIRAGSNPTSISTAIYRYGPYGVICTGKLPPLPHPK